MKITVNAFLVSLDWLRSEADEKIKVHQGFSQQYNSVRNDLWAIVKVILSL